MNKKAFGKSLKEFRNKKNITQEELADKIHVSQQAISKWEQGLAYPDFEILEQVCKELDISEYDLFDQTRILEAEEEKRKTVTAVVGGILGIGMIVLIFSIVSGMTSKKTTPIKNDNTPATQVEQVTPEATKESISEEIKNEILEVYKDWNAVDKRKIDITECRKRVDTEVEKCEKLTTEDLVELCIAYPYANDVSYYSRVEMGIDALKEQSNVYKTLFERDDHKKAIYMKNEEIKKKNASSLEEEVIGYMMWYINPNKDESGNIIMTESQEENDRLLTPMPEDYGFELTPEELEKLSAKTEE